MSLLNIIGGGGADTGVPISNITEFFQTSVPFLGHIVGRHGLECDPVKIEDVKSWPVPDCLKSVRQFWGFVRYYRQFIPNFADIATPMVALTGKDVPFVWDPVCSTAFYTLRDSLIHAPILAFPTETGQYILDTDASNFGWAVSSVRSRVMWNVWLLIVAAPFNPHNDIIAPLNGKFACSTAVPVLHSTPAGQRSR